MRKAKDAQGQVFKDYEKEQDPYLNADKPIIVRVDGRSFHQYTRNLEKPFDIRLIESMDFAASGLAEEIQGCFAYYVQSDEASFLIRKSRPESGVWFGGRVIKMASIAAALMSVNFNKKAALLGLKPNAMFDGRAFNVEEDDIKSYLKWRIDDCKRNSRMMVCRSFFSHKQLANKKAVEQEEMLASVGVSLLEYGQRAVNGALFQKSEESGKFTSTGCANYMK